jgi:hypothetical protein
MNRRNILSIGLAALVPLPTFVTNNRFKKVDLNKVANKIAEGGKTVIVLGTFRDSKLLLKALSKLLPFTKRKHEPECYEIWTPDWSVAALPATPKIRGYRADNLIYDSRIPVEIAGPLISVRFTNASRWRLNADDGKINKISLYYGR